MNQGLSQKCPRWQGGQSDHWKFTGANGVAGDCEGEGGGRGNGGGSGGDVPYGRGSCGEGGGGRGGRNVICAVDAASKAEAAPSMGCGGRLTHDV